MSNAQIVMAMAQRRKGSTFYTGAVVSAVGAAVSALEAQDFSPKRAASECGRLVASGHLTTSRTGWKFARAMECAVQSPKRPRVSSPIPRSRTRADFLPVPYRTKGAVQNRITAPTPPTRKRRTVTRKPTKSPKWFNRPSTAPYLELHTASRAAAHFGVTDGHIRAVAKRLGVKCLPADHSCTIPRNARSRRFLATHTVIESMAGFNASKYMVTTTARALGVKPQPAPPRFKIARNSQNAENLRNCSNAEAMEAFGVAESTVIYARKDLNAPPPKRGTDRVNRCLETQALNNVPHGPKPKRRRFLVDLVASMMKPDRWITAAEIGKRTGCSYCETVAVLCDARFKAVRRQGFKLRTVAKARPTKIGQVTATLNDAVDPIAIDVICAATGLTPHWVKRSIRTLYQRGDLIVTIGESRLYELKS